MTATFTTTGTIADGKIVTLDTTAPVGVGRVRVTVEPVIEPPPLNLTGFFDQLRQEQQARGHVSRTREEIDAAMREERAGWDHRP